MHRASSDSLRSVYERRAQLQYAAPVPLPDPRVDRKFGRLLELVEATLPAESLLDAGCGDGRFLAAISRLPNSPRRLVGTDIAGRILETAALTIAREGGFAELTRANLEQLPFPDASFERVLSAQVIEHLLEPEAGIAELARVLVPGGLLVLSTDNSHAAVSRGLNAPRTALVHALHLTGGHALVTFPHTSFSRDEIVSLTVGAGLEVESVWTFKFHVDGLDIPFVKRLLASADRVLPPHPWGDIIALVARKPHTG